MTSTYEKIATNTLGSSTITLTFSSIPSTYTDLLLVSTGTNVSQGDIKMRFNGDTGNNYSETAMLGNGSAASSFRTTNAGGITHNYMSTTIASAITQINNYSNSTTNKTTLTRWNAPTSGDPYVAAYVGLWRNTAAITSLTLFLDSVNMAAGSTFTLYGIKAE
jgi:hypothetical protein